MKQKNILQTLLSFLFLIPFFRIPYFTKNFAIASKLYTILEIIGFVFIVIICLYQLIKKKYKPSTIIYMIGIFYFIFAVSSFINGNNVKTIVINAIQNIGLCLFIDYSIKHNLKSFTQAILLLFECFVYINLITILVYPNGLYVVGVLRDNWFLGYDNSHILYLLPAIMIAYLYNYIENRKITIRTVILTIAVVLSILIRKSATALIAFGLIICFFLVYRFLKHTKVFNIISYFAVQIISFFAIIVFRLQELFSFLIVDILHKDLTFTGRTKIWSRTLELMNGHWLYGFGLEDTAIRTQKYDWILATTAHNQILELFYQGGLLLFGAFAAIMYCLIKPLLKFSDTWIGKFFAWIVLTYAMMMITEAYSYQDLFYIYVIISSVALFVNYKELHEIEILDIDLDDFEIAGDTYD